jgi:uncharacterized cupredoxin-like copper-binding protein
MVRQRWARPLMASTAFVLVVSVVGCSDDPENAGSTSAAASSATGPSTVDVTLSEFAVGVDAASAPAGSVTFEVSNAGPDDEHEFVVIRTDLSFTDLPTDKDGAVEEEGEGLEAVDEIEGIPVDGSESLTVDLAAGSYALICNILQKEPDGTLEAHYSKGMRAGFTVE